MDKEFLELVKSGKLYDPNNQELMDYQETLKDLIHDYNATRSNQEGIKKRTELLKKMCAEVGEGVYLEAPIYSNFGLKNVHLGNGVYANFHLTLVDDGEIFIGDSTLIGPNVTIATACHPISPTLRSHALEYNLTVKIGKNCWIGAGAIIMPGVTIGDNSIIGAGSIVTKDIPNNVVAVGNPCKVMRPITKEDEIYYNHDIKIDEDILKRYR